MLGDKIGGLLIVNGLDGAEVVIRASGEVLANGKPLGNVMDILFPGKRWRR